MDLVKVGNVIIPTQVNNSFNQLVSNCYSNLGVNIKLLDGFKPDTAIRTELRKRLKNEDLKGKILTTEQFDSLQPTDFEPPLTIGNKLANRNTNEVVYAIPNKIGLDPRTTGRIIKIGPKNLITPTLLYYLVHNAGRYGFIHYGPKDPSIWYWRGDRQETYTAEEVVNTFTSELKYLL